MTLTVQRLGHHGDGIAVGADGPVFIPGALPGEEVAGDVVGDRLAQPRIVTPSPDRIRAPCPHYRACGGCALQHASDGFVAAWKTQVVEAALAAQGIAAELRPILTSPPRSRRRAALSGRRTKAGAMIGFHGRGSDQLVDTPGCLLLHPELMALRPALEEVTMAGASRKGELTLTLTRAIGGADLAVTGGKPLDAALRRDLAVIAGRHSIARLSWEGEVAVQAAEPFHRFGVALVSPPPGAFLQATAQGEAALLAAVREIVGNASRVRDLFCGSGTFALPLAERAEVLAVEGSAPAIRALERGWRGAEGLRKVTAEARDLFRRPLLGPELKRLDAVVIDPPRAGAEAQMREIAAAGVPRLAGVSCNPLTFARDARILTDAGYRLDWVQPVDQFRWSTHVELVASFHRA
mgnify:FL=1